MEPASIFVDRLTYTASLATRFEDIDHLLEPVREVTARIDQTKPLSEADRNIMLTVQQQIETYLVTKERIRLFTPESLRLQIEQHARGDVNHNSRLQLRIVIGVAFTVAAAVGLLLPLSSIEQRIQAGGATAFSLLTVGAASLFWTALKAFQSELRRAFLFICAGVALLGVSLLGQPIMEIFNLRQYPLTSIAYSSPILISAVLFHIGDALYVRLVGAKNWWTTPAPVIIGAVVLSVFSWFVPHPPTSESELVHDFVAVIWAVMLITPIASAIVLPMAVRRLPELYKPPATLLFQAMFPIIAVVAYQYVVRIIAGPYMTGPVAYVLFSLVTLMGLALVRAGYAFHKVSRY